MKVQTLRLPAEEIHSVELEALAKGDDRQQPPSWKLSPQSVVTYLMGGTAKDGTPISSKYIGNRRLIETAVATLATDRALLLLGLPGTAKSWYPNILPRQSQVHHSGSFNAPPVRTRTKSATGGTMLCCWRKDRPPKRSEPW